MGEKPLDFLQFDVIYTRQGDSNKWTRRIERRTDPVKTGAKGIISSITFLWEDEPIKDEKRFHCTVNIECDPLLIDPNTFGIVPEDLQYYEEEALNLTDKEFKKKFPEAEFTPWP